MASDAAPRYVERKDKSRGVSVLSGDKMTLFVAFSHKFLDPFFRCSFMKHFRNNG